MSYGGLTESDVRDLVHGAIFTRSPKDLHHTAVFIGGADVSAGERLLAAVGQAFFGRLRVSVMLDSNGSNTTAVAAIAKMQHAAGTVSGRRVVVTAGTGPVGVRAASLLAQAGARVVITSRRPARSEAVNAILQRFGGTVREVTLSDPSHAAAVLDGAEMLLNTGPAGVCLVPRDAWAGRSGLRVVVDLNAVPPPGVEGVASTDDGVERDGITTFGALGVGNLKMRVHKACIGHMFERNDLVLDVDTIAAIARNMAQPRSRL